MPKSLWKKYVRIAHRIILKVKDHQLDFEVDWLNSACEWIEAHKYVTPTQMGAMDRAREAVESMIRYRKLVARRKT